MRVMASGSEPAKNDLVVVHRQYTDRSRIGAAIASKAEDLVSSHEHLRKGHYSLLPLSLVSLFHHAYRELHHLAGAKITQSKVGYVRSARAAKVALPF